MLYAYPSMYNYASIITIHLLSICLLMHMNFNFSVCLMHSSGFMFQFTCLLIYLCFCWLSLNSLRSFLRCVLPFYSSSLFFPGMKTFQPSSTWSFCKPTSVLKLQQFPLGSHAQIYLYETFHHPRMK
jgi:hypothetical protein